MKKLLGFSSLLATVAGLILVAGGLWGIIFTYQNISREQITTPSDATIPDTPVRGPLTLKSQADVIRRHVLESTSGQTYAQMPRDSAERPIWITATTLTTALHLGILTYGFSALVIFLGLISIWNGILFAAMRKRL